MPWIRPVPEIVSPSGPTEHRAPIRPSTSRIAPAACRLSRGQSGMVTVPPVTSAAARNGPALDRSGSTVTEPRSEPSRPHPPGVRPGAGPASAGSQFLHRGAGRAEHAHGHRDVRRRGHRRSLVPHLDALVEPGRRQQQARDQLRGTRSIEHHGAAADRAAAVHGERDRGPAAVLDLRAELPQRRQDRADRALPGPRVPVEGDHGRGQRGQAGHEPHHRARVAHVHAHRGTGAGCPGVTTQSVRDSVISERSVIPLPRARRASAASVGVPGPQRVGDHGRAVAERGQDQGPVGDGLGGRQPDARADRAGGGRGSPGPVLVVNRVHTVERMQC